MIAPISPYHLNADVKAQFLAMAAESDLIVIGEMHGTQEIPRMVLGLLPELAQLGYGGLAFELLASERDQLLACAAGKAKPPQSFGPQYFRDGRANAQALSLVQQAIRNNWQLICFDQWGREDSTWADRDRGMAVNLLNQWDSLCRDRKVLGICGNMHSRLVQPQQETDFWPSFAFNAKELRPGLIVNTINVVFHAGEFFNGEVRSFSPNSGEQLTVSEWRPESRQGHSADLHLPRATAVTFIDAADDADASIG